MSAPKTAYLNRIRNETAYPMFRNFVKFWRIINLVLGGAIAVTGLVMAGFFREGWIVFIYIPVGALAWAICEAMREVSNTIVDIADSVIDLNYRYEHREEARE